MTDNSPVTRHPQLDDIYGQTFAKRALTIAAAGRHNILFTGPPGTGKTLLARTLANLLPPPTPEELLEITKLHTLVTTSSIPQFSRPFRAPHHTASSTAIIGGGNQIAPGEISLAHCGILFLDELPEYRRDVLEALRQPLENHIITVTRARGNATYPANFMLVATMNPCPCGNLNHPHKSCTCTALQIKNYQNRLSGPVLDRIDLIIEVQPVSSQNLLQFDVKSPTQNVVKNTKTDGKTSIHSKAQEDITRALLHQHTRYKKTGRYNSDLSSTEIAHYLHPTPDAIKLLNTATDKFNLSTRAYFKIIKVAQTIADLTDSSKILPEHISEALSFRMRKPE